MIGRFEKLKYFMFLGIDHLAIVVHLQLQSVLVH